MAAVGQCVLFLMFINVHELELHAIEFAERIAPQVIDFGPDLRQQTPLQSEGRAELVREHHGGKQFVDDIRLTGGLATRIEVSCARCLEPVVQDVSRRFDLLYRPQGADAGRDELSVTAAEAEIGYYTGEGVQLEEVLREQVLLALPFKTVCREDCKGLCPHCGKNLNVESCSCVRDADDPRWGSLKDIRDKLKS